MSKYKPPKGSKQPDSGQSHGTNDRRRISGEISVAGKIETDLPPKLVQEYEASNRDTNTRENKRAIVELLTLFFIILTVVAAFIQARQSIRASNAAENAVNIASKTLQLDQRAWIGPVEIVRPMFTEEGKPSYVATGYKTTLGVFITNSGKSPGLKVKTKTRLKAVDSGEVFVWDYPPADSNITDSVSVVQPGMRLELDSLPSGVPLTPDHIKKIREGTGKIYFYGEITYEDIFTTFHVTHFCVVLTPDLQQLTNCQTYNDAN